DTKAPIVTVPTAISAVATTSGGAVVSYTIARATDIVDGTDAVTCTTAPTAGLTSGSRFPIGTTTVTCKSTDAHNNTGTATFTVTVAHSAPVCTSAVANPAMLWPPNHKLVSIGIDGVTDADGGTKTFKVVSIFQDEPTNGLGDGDTA